MLTSRMTQADMIAKDRRCNSRLIICKDTPRVLARQPWIATYRDPESVSVVSTKRLRMGWVSCRLARPALAMSWTFLANEQTNPSGGCSSKSFVTFYDILWHFDIGFVTISRRFKERFLHSIPDELAKVCLEKSDACDYLWSHGLKMPEVSSH